MNLPEPSPLWQWHFDPKDSWLCLALDKLGTLKTGLARKNLRDKNFQFEAFSVADTGYYTTLLEAFEATPLAENARFAFVTCINALASAQYHKEVAAKNWFFQESSYIPEVADHQLASVQTSYGQSDVLILQTRDNFNNCLLMQSLALSEEKLLSGFSMIKVSSNRLFPFTGQSCTAFDDY